MNDWRAMPVIEEKIPDSKNRFRFTVGCDTIEMAISFPRGCFFEYMEIEILDHYIRERNNKPNNPRRTSLLRVRIYEHLRMRYLEELKKVFYDIATQPAGDRISKSFDCMGENCYVAGTPEKVFSWFWKHYTSTCASGDFWALVTQVPRTDGFFSEEIACYLNV